MQLTAGITKATTGIDGIVWNILGQTYVPKSLSDNQFSWHATFPPGTFVPPHIHPTQDEFIYVLDGEATLETNTGPQILRPGMCVGFPAGSAEAHCFVNNSSSDVLLLVIGDRTAGDQVAYPDIDLHGAPGPDGTLRFARKDGTPYS